MARLVLVPGAWHIPTHYSSIFAALGRHGYIVDSVANKTLGSTTATVSDDAAVHQQLILALIEAGHDVIVMAHSYGGVPAGIAAAGLSKATRLKEGKKGGVIGLIYISSFVIPASTSILDALGGKPHDFLKIEGDIVWPDSPEHHFYADCKPDDVSVAVKLIRHQATNFITTSSDVVPAWQEEAYAGKKCYLICLKDQALPLDAQRHMSAGWDVGEIDTDHSPFMSRTEETASWIVEKVKQLSV